MEYKKIIKTKRLYTNITTKLSNNLNIDLIFDLN
jgi:hypothetical protein